MLPTIPNTSQTSNPVERLVVVETLLAEVIRRLDHQDKCVDGLKRQVWIATGAVSILMAVLSLYEKFLQ